MCCEREILKVELGLDLFIKVKVAKFSAKIFPAFNTHRVTPRMISLELGRQARKSHCFVWLELRVN
jgi:hypothetical protein